MSEPMRIQLKIAGQSFTLKAPEEEHERLERIAGEVESRVQEVQASGISSPQRAALMAAFQFAYDLDQAPTATSKDDQQKARKKLESLISRLDDAME